MRWKDRGCAALSVAMGLFVPTAAHAATASQAYTTPGEHVFVVPPAVFSVSVMLVGGNGGAGAGTTGGAAATETGTIAVTPGESLYAEVGGNGGNGDHVDGGVAGYNGGGSRRRTHSSTPRPAVEAAARRTCGESPPARRPIPIAPGLPARSDHGSSWRAAEAEVAERLSSATLPPEVSAARQMPQAAAAPTTSTIDVHGGGGARGQTTGGGAAGSDPGGSVSGVTPGTLGAGGNGGTDGGGGGGGGGGGVFGGGGGGGGSAQVASPSPPVVYGAGGGGGGGGASTLPPGPAGVTGLSLLPTETGAEPQITLTWTLPAPTATTTAASAVTFSSAILHGTVNPNATPLSGCQFAISPDAAGWFDDLLRAADRVGNGPRTRVRPTARALAVDDLHRPADRVRRTGPVDRRSSHVPYPPPASADLGAWRQGGPAPRSPPGLHHAEGLRGGDADRHLRAEATASGG